MVPAVAGEQLDNAQQPLAEISSANGYQGLIGAFRARAEERRIVISGSVNTVAGLPANYLAKLLSPKAPRRIGALSLGPLLGALGLRLLVLPDEDATQRFDGRIDKHQLPIRSGTTEFRISRRFMREIQAKGRKARWEKMTVAQRAEWARRMNQLRWAKVKSQASAIKRGSKPRVRSERRGEIAT